MFFSGHGELLSVVQAPPSRGRREMDVIFAPKEEEIICSGCELE